jgi:hypothetical protein
VADAHRRRHGLRHVRQRVEPSLLQVVRLEPYEEESPSVRGARFAAREPAPSLTIRSASAASARQRECLTMLRSRSCPRSAACRPCASWIFNSENAVPVAERPATRAAGALAAAACGAAFSFGGSWTGVNRRVEARERLPRRRSHANLHRRPAPAQRPSTSMSSPFFKVELEATANRWRPYERPPVSRPDIFVGRALGRASAAGALRRPAEDSAAEVGVSSSAAQDEC